MLVKSELKRVFIHKENGQEVRLTDPGEGFQPQAVMDFYSATYPILTNARISGPEKLQYDTIAKDQVG